MARIIPDYSGRTNFSASVHNNWNRILLSQFHRAAGDFTPFSKLDPEEYTYSGSTETAWQGYILYTGLTNTFRYDFTNNNTNSVTRIKVDGTTVKSATGTATDGAGTVTLSGLTPNTVYPVTVEGEHTGGGGGVIVDWLGLSHTPTYTAPPTFTTAFTVSGLADIAAGIAQIEDLLDFPNATFPFEQTTVTHVNDNYDVRWQGTFYYRHDKLFYRADNSEEKGEFVVAVNGTEVVNDQTNGTATGTVDISSLGLTIGNRYDITAGVKRHDSASSEELTIGIQYLAFRSALTQTAPTLWAEGDTLDDDNVDQDFNWQRDVINRIHPGASSPDVPFIYEQPAIKTPVGGSLETDPKFYSRRLKPYLKYVYDGDDTPEVFDISGTSLADLSSSSGVQSYDLETNLVELPPGLLYHVDDVSTAQEADFA